MVFTVGVMNIGFYCNEICYTLRMDLPESFTNIFQKIGRIG